MKKFIFSTIFILSTIITILIVNIFIPKKTIITYELIEEENTNYIYFVSGDILVGLPIKTPNKTKYELIEEYFLYLTSKSNSVSKEYHTKLVLSSTLISYEIQNDDLYLEVSDNFFNIKEEDIKYVFGQILYSYNELGYKKIYLKKGNEIVKEMGDIVLYNGLNDLSINVINTSNSINQKRVKIIYYYKNNTKTFINYFINESLDENTFKLNKIIEFINTEYSKNITLNNFYKTDKELIVDITCNDSDIKLIEKLLFNNFEINKSDIQIIIT